MHGGAKYEKPVLMIRFGVLRELAAAGLQGTTGGVPVCGTCCSVAPVGGERF